MKKLVYLLMFLIMISGVISIDTVFLSYNQVSTDTSANIVSLGNFTINNVYNINETDPIYTAKRNELIFNSSNGQTAYTWGNHASVGYITGSPWTLLGYTTYNDSLVSMAIEGSNAYGWGDHHLEGYLTSYIDTDTNDTLRVNALWGENTSIYGILYETYTNMTGITSYNDSAVVNALQIAEALNTAKISYNDSTVVNALQIAEALNTAKISYNDSTVVNSLQIAESLNTAKISYNDSFIVDRLQAENTTIWNMVYEFNQNDTALNLSIEQRTSYNDSGIVDRLQAENISIYNILYELNQNDTADSLRDNSSIEARTSYNDSAVVNALQAENTSIYGILYETYTNMTGITSYNDSAVVNALQIAEALNTAKISYNDSTVVNALQIAEALNTAKISYNDSTVVNSLQIAESLNTAKISYNDSFIVDRLQVENTTIWNMVYEFNQNDTALNLSIEQRTSYNDSAVVDRLQAENISIYNILYELNQNDTADSLRDNSSIESRTSYNDSAVVNALQVENTSIYGILYETYANITGITSYNDSAVVNALQGENITIWNTLREINDNTTALNLSIEQRTSYNDSTVVDRLQAENTTIWNMAYEFNQNVTALNLSVEQRSPLESPSFTGNVLINGGYGAGGISLTSNGSALIYEDLLIGGDILSVGTTVLNGSFLPNTNGSYNLGGEDNYFNYVFSKYFYIDGATINQLYVPTYMYASGDIFTDSAGADLWLGAYLQGDSHMRLYANGTLRADEIITSGKDVCISGGNCLSTSAYNDSAVVNGLQAENTTIWNMAYEFNQNITALNLSVEQRAPLASPTFTGTVSIPTPFTINSVSMTTTGVQLNYLKDATGTTGGTGGNIVFAGSPTFSGVITAVRLIIPELNATNFTLNGAAIVGYNDSVVVNALQGENITVWNALREINDNTTALNLSIEQITPLTMAYEFNQNDTALNLSVEQRAPSATPSFTGTVTTAGAINETLALGTGTTVFVTHIDFGNVSLVSNLSHFCLKGKSMVCIET
jgi:hypothetical protein